VSTHGLIEISLSGLDDEATPSVIGLFDRWGRGGAVVEQMPANDPGTTVKTYLLPEDDESLRQIEIGLEVLKHALSPSLPGDSPADDPLPEPHIRFLSETDWAEAWKTHYDVLRVGRRLVVKPTWRDYAPNPDDLIIELDPGMAFGSGLHPTTRLCMEAMETHLRPGASVLDVGTGSGILAVAAARLGALRILALDTDPLAVRVARENVALNKVEDVARVDVGTVQISNTKSQVANRKSANRQIGKHLNHAQVQMPATRRGDAPGISSLQSPSWDLVVANILAETVVELMPALVSNLAAEGALIASGIIADRAEVVIASLHKNDLALTERREDGEWVALVAGNETKDERRSTND
jgi:ribosomal protein L11 methyltransferase